jgi:hypothetical protein
VCRAIRLSSGQAPGPDLAWHAAPLSAMQSMQSKGRGDPHPRMGRTADTGAVVAGSGLVVQKDRDGKGQRLANAGRSGPKVRRAGPVNVPSTARLSLRWSPKGFPVMASPTTPYAYNRSIVASARVVILSQACPATKKRPARRG